VEFVPAGQHPHQITLLKPGQADGALVLVLVWTTCGCSEREPVPVHHVWRRPLVGLVDDGLRVFLIIIRKLMIIDDRPADPDQVVDLCRIQSLAALGQV
jgi:hypothetical protein